MDPVSHAAFGRVLIGLDDQRRLGPGAAAAAVAGTLSPDVDLILASQGWDVYLRAHQAGTHALIGAIGCGIVAAAAVRALTRGSRLLPLCVAAIGGALSHPVLDLVSGADIRPFWPLSGVAVTLPLFAMADPWLIAFFLIALVTLWRRPRARTTAGVLLALIALVTAKAATYHLARAIDSAHAPGAPVHGEAVFGSWGRWIFFHADADSVERWQVDAFSGQAGRAFRAERRVRTPEAIASLALSTVDNLVAGHRATFARVQQRADREYEVRWSDLRYCAAALAGSEPVCAIWMGGQLDAGGRPRSAFAQVGGFVRRRSAPADHK